MKIHIIKQGDTLYHLAQKYHVTVDELLKHNSNIKDPYNLEIGSKLRIPSVSTSVGSGGSGGMHMGIIHQHVVTSGDTMWKLSQEWGVSLASLIAANKHIHNPNVLKTGDVINIPKTAATTAHDVVHHLTHHLVGHQATEQHVTAQAAATPPHLTTPDVSVSMPTIPSILQQLLPGFQMHTVVSGDTLYHISKKYGVALDDIIALNPNITNPNQLTVGMKVLIPKGAMTPSDIPIVDITTHQKYIVQSGDTLWKLSNAWHIPLNELVAANKQLSNPNVLQVGEIINIPKSYSVDLSGQFHAQQATNMSANQNAANQHMINPKKANNQMMSPKKANNQIMPTQAAPAKQPTPIQISPTINVAPTINVTKTTVVPKQQVIAAQTGPKTVAPMQVKPAVTAQTIAPMKVKTEPIAAAKVESVVAKVMPVANANAKVESVATKVMPLANANAKVESVATKVMPLANANAKVESVATKVMPLANANAKVESVATKVMPLANANAKVESVATKVMPLANANAKVESVATKVMPLANANAKVESIATKVMPLANANAKVESVATKVMPLANANAKVESIATKVMPLANSKMEPMAMKMMPVANSKLEPLASKMMPVANSKMAPVANKVYSGYKPLPADLEQHPYFPNAEMLHQYQTPNSVIQSNMGKFKPMMNPGYKMPVAPYPSYAPMQYYDPCGCQAPTTQGNWGYVQPMNYGNNMNQGGATIAAQSAMYPPTHYAPNTQSYQNQGYQNQGYQTQGYQNPWNTDCGCGGTPQAYAQDAANTASKLGPVTKVKKTGKKVTIQATKKSPKKPQGNKPWLNV